MVVFNEKLSLYNDYVSCLEAQLLEEPLGLTSLVLVFKDLLQLSADLLLLGGILEELGGNGCLDLSHLERVAGGHQVGIVDDLDEGLDAAAAGNLLGVHVLGNLQGSTLNTGNQGTAKLLTSTLITLIEMYRDG